MITKTLYMVFLHYNYFRIKKNCLDKLESQPIIGIIFVALCSENLLKKLLFIYIITADQVETPVLTYDETAVTKAKMESSGMNVTSLLSSRQSTSDH